MYTQEIWRDDCGEVALYPQGGTWVYDRANWCPGDKATTREHELTNFLSTGQTNLLDFDIYKANWNPAEASYIYDVHGKIITTSKVSIMQKGIAKMQLQEFEHTELKKYLTLVFTLHT